MSKLKVVCSGWTEVLCKELVFVSVKAFEGVRKSWVSSSLSGQLGGQAGDLGPWVSRNELLGYMTDTDKE